MADNANTEPNGAVNPVNPDLTPMLGERPQFIPLLNISGSDYLGVAEAIAWARRDWGLRLQILTDLLGADGQGRPEGVKAELYIDGVLIAMGMARIEAPRGNRNADDYSDLENAETSAIGRALRALGYGTSQALAYNGVAPRQPQRPPQRQPQRQNPPRPPQNNRPPWEDDADMGANGNAVAPVCGVCNNTKGVPGIGRDGTPFPTCFNCRQEQLGRAEQGAS